MVLVTRARPKTQMEKVRALANLLRKFKKFQKTLSEEIVKIAEELANNKVEEYFIQQNEKVILKKVGKRICVNVSNLSKTDRVKAIHQYSKRGYTIE